MQITCHTLLMLGALAAQPDSREPFYNPLNSCKLTIIDEIQVPAEQEGVLIELHVREGEMVEKGALLGQIDDRDAKMAAAIAKYAMESARKKAENTLEVQSKQKLDEYRLAEYQLTTEANEKNKLTFSKTEVNLKRAQYDIAHIDVELSKHALELARLDYEGKTMEFKRMEGALDKRKIISRINGVVAEVHKHAGDWVQPGETVLRVIRMDQLRVEGFLDGTKHARHEVIGRPVQIVVQLTGDGVERLEGKITLASPVVESNQYKVWAEIDNRRAANGQWLLNPGLNARMSLISDGALSANP